MKTAADHSDALIQGSEEIPAELSDYMTKLKKPILPYKNREEFTQAYQDFYNEKVLPQ